MSLAAYLGRQLAVALFWTWAAFQAGLMLVMGAFLILRWPLLARIPPAEAWTFLFVEIGPTSLALALPAGLALHLQRLRQSGEMQALWSLPLAGFRSRLPWILSLLAFVLLHSLWAGRIAPQNRAHLEQSLGDPLLLLAGGRYEELDRAAAELGGLALSYETVQGSMLQGVTLLRREGDHWLALSAGSLEMHGPGEIRLRDGRMWSSDDGPLLQAGFGSLDLELLGGPDRQRWDGSSLERRATWTTGTLVVGLLLVLLVLGRRADPGRIGTLLAWGLPPVLFLVGASA